MVVVSGGFSRITRSVIQVSRGRRWPGEQRWVEHGPGPVGGRTTTAFDTAAAAAVADQPVVERVEMLLEQESGGLPLSCEQQVRVDGRRRGCYNR